MQRFLKFSQLKRKFDIPDEKQPAEQVASEEAMKERNERERLEELVDEVKSVTIVSDTKKRKVDRQLPIEGKASVVLPPIEARKYKPNSAARAAGAGAAGILFTATYDDASVLGKVLGKMDKFTNAYSLIFTNTGLESMFMERSRAMAIEVNVPKGSFARYTTLAERAIEFVVTAKAMKNFGDLCEQGSTLTFTYDQCGAESEPLELKLYPADGDVRSTQVVRLTLPAQTTDEPAIVPDDVYQFAVRMSSKLFLKNVRACARESQNICLSLTGDSFDLIAVAGESEHMLLLPIAVQQNDAPDAELGEKSCIVWRVGGTQGVTEMAMHNYRLSSAFLESAAALGAVPQCSEVILRIGVSARANDKYDEVPLHMRFPVCAGKPDAFDVNVWLASKQPED